MHSNVAARESSQGAEIGRVNGPFMAHLVFGICASRW